MIGDYKGRIKGGKQFVGQLNTKWSVVYKFNSIFYTLLAVQSLCLLVGAHVIPLRIITSFIHCFVTGFIHMAMVITTGVYRYNVLGRACAESVTHTSKETTFKADGEFIQRLFIS